MTIDFYVDKNRLDECLTFIRSLPSARFNYNPLKVKDGNFYNINITLDVEDGNILSQLFETWHEQDNSIKTH